MMMRFYWVIRLGDYIGCRKFATEAEAAEVADKMTRLSGKTWTVGKIYY